MPLNKENKTTCHYNVMPFGTTGADRANDAIAINTAEFVKCPNWKL